MTSEPQPLQAWAIMGPDGIISRSHMSKSQAVAIDIFSMDFSTNDTEFWSGNTWPRLEAEGYRAVRVQITETPDE